MKTQNVVQKTAVIYMYALGQSLLQPILKFNFYRDHLGFQI